MERKSKRRLSFEETAHYCEETFGCTIITDEETGRIDAFTCPECDEPLHLCDYVEDTKEENTYDWTICPVCGGDLYE